MIEQAHQCRDSGNEFRFPDFASHTGRFRLIFVRISSVVSFRLDIRQLSDILNNGHHYKIIANGHLGR